MLDFISCEGSFDQKSCEGGQVFTLGGSSRRWSVQGPPSSSGRSDRLLSIHLIDFEEIISSYCFRDLFEHCHCCFFVDELCLLLIALITDGDGDSEDKNDYDGDVLLQLAIRSSQACRSRG